jgi:hypothetical protein
MLCCFQGCGAGGSTNPGTSRAAEYPGDRSVRVDTAMAGTEALLFGLFELVGLEAHSPALVKYLVDLASAPGALEVMNDHVVLVAQETLSSFGLRWSCHSFSH